MIAHFDSIGDVGAVLTTQVILANVQCRPLRLSKVEPGP